LPLPALDVSLRAGLFLEKGLGLFLVIPEGRRARAIFDLGYPFFFALDVKETLEEWSVFLRV
jgi:hypothetical protein